MVTQLLAVHCRTFNVPAWTARAPRRRPARFALFRHLPQNEVHRVAFVVDHVNARACLQLVEILTRQHAICRIGRDVEHHVAVVRHISVTFGDQLFSEFNNFCDMVRRARLHIRAQNVQRIKIFVHFGDHAIHQRHKAFAIFIGAFDDFVVDIGNVAHILQLIAEETQIARNHVKSNKGTPVTDMTEIVNGDSTHVHADFPGVNRLKFLFLACQSIEDF